MGQVVVGLSMSLDGFIAGPNDGPGNSLGAGVRLFANLEARRVDLECTRVVVSDGVTHLRYRVVR
ncbi:MAG: hypothetical protein WB802_07820 [Candidatus Dormiibacterota bacterium]|jgi:hypothetical protein